MNITLSKALAALIPAGRLFCGAAVQFRSARNACLLMQIVGAACLVLVVLRDVAEGLHRYFHVKTTGSSLSASRCCTMRGVPGSTSSCAA